MANTIPDVTYHLFERSAHVPSYEERELFDRLLLEWVDQSPPAT